LVFTASAESACPANAISTASFFAADKGVAIILPGDDQKGSANPILRYVPWSDETGLIF